MGDPSKLCLKQRRSLSGHKCMQAMMRKGWRNRGATFRGMLWTWKGEQKRTAVDHQQLILRDRMTRRLLIVSDPITLDQKLVCTSFLMKQGVHIFCGGRRFCQLVTVDQPRRRLLPKRLDERPRASRLMLVSLSLIPHSSQEEWSPRS
jgi:hypothetical protein